jgi:hypothetical protein
MLPVVPGPVTTVFYSLPLKLVGYCDIILHFKEFGNHKLLNMIIIVIIIIMIIIIIIIIVIMMII